MHTDAHDSKGQRALSSDVGATGRAARGARPGAGASARVNNVEHAVGRACVEAKALKRQPLTPRIRDDKPQRNLLTSVSAVRPGTSR